MRTERIRNDEDGFTLIELLIVILIVGILASVSLSVFMAQKKKGQDAASKSDARNAVTQVESCFTSTQDYTGCVNASQLGTTGLDIGGSIIITAVATDYSIAATSKSTNVFTIAKVAGAAVTRTCTVGAGGIGGGCKVSGGSW
jgi:type IV pilus assembly protein PilA